MKVIKMFGLNVKKIIYMIYIRRMLNFYNDRNKYHVFVRLSANFLIRSISLSDTLIIISNPFFVIMNAEIIISKGRIELIYKIFQKMIFFLSTKYPWSICFHILIRSSWFNHILIKDISESLLIKLKSFIKILRIYAVLSWFKYTIILPFNTIYKYMVWLYLISYLMIYIMAYNS